MVILRRNVRRSTRSHRAMSMTPEPTGVVSSLMNPDSPHSPLFIHSSDHPGMKLVSIILDGSNYNQWKSAMLIALNAKNKVVFIDDSHPRLDEGQRQAQAKVDITLTVKFLAGLNEKYSIIRSQIIMKKPLPPLAEICNILDQDDSQRHFNSHVVPVAFQVSQGNNQAGLLPSPGPSIGTLNAVHKKDSKPIYSYCGLSGHTVDRCYKVHGYPVGWKKGKSDKVPDKVSSPAAASPSVVVAAHVSTPSLSSGSLDSLVGNMSKEQIQSFIAFFSSQLQTELSPVTTSVGPPRDPSGSYQGVSDWTR